MTFHARPTRATLAAATFVSLGCTVAVADILPRFGAEEIYVDTPFSVTFETSAAGVGEPDLAPLADDFAVVGSARSSHLALENGRIQRRQQLTLTLAPLQAGEVTLPALQFGPEASRPVTFTVRPQDAIPSGASQILLEVEVEPPEVLVQQQVLVRVRVIRPRDVDLDSARLSDPSVSGGDAIIEPLGKDRAFSTLRDGQPVEVIERRFAVVPQSSGELLLEPLLLDARRLAGALSLSNPFGVQIRPIQLRSEAQRIRVEAAPPLEPGRHWLPAEGLALSEAWSGLDEAGRARVGEPIVRTVGMMADGLTAAQLPSLDHPVAEGVNQYSDPPNLATQRNPEGLSAQRTEKLVLIPTRPGLLSLPPVNVTWWNLSRKRFDTAALPGRAIEILPAVNGSPGGATGETGGPSVAEGRGTTADPARTGDRVPGLDTAFDRPLDGASVEDGSALPSPLPSPLPERAAWLATGLLLGALLAGLAARRGRRAHLQTAGGAARPRGAAVAGARHALARVMQAAGRNDALAAQNALFELAPHLPDFRQARDTVRSLARIEAELPAGPLRSAIVDLQRHRYGSAESSTGPWNGRLLRDALRALSVGDPSSPRGRPRGARLPPLKPDPGQP